MAFNSYYHTTAIFFVMPMLSKIRQYRLLFKFNLTFLVVFSSVMSYLLTDNTRFTWRAVLLLSLGGFAITAAANSLNQVLEKHSDALMSRTRMRPVAAGDMSETEAIYTAVLMMTLGFFVLGFTFNWRCAIVSMVSLALYAWVYTPMKKQTPFSVLVGALPGALPCLIGWLAADGEHWSLGILLFSYQFIWQFPHFWAIAWLAHKDYAKAGFKLLPSVSGPSKYAALQSILYAIVLIPIGFVPLFLGVSGYVSAVVIFVANILLLLTCIALYREMTNRAARRVMFACYFHLPIFFFSLLWDKMS